ncbi:MAG TPA: IPT/TIG domain-containing protein, partial [Gemmatimonadaceae bacterium]|nr:IPT/TIG domain-containing protein [Gemmatimonadaceae bacterium]
GIITVANATGVATFTGGGQPYYQYGGTQATVDSAALGVEGILSPAETSVAKTWQLSMPATVNAFTFQLLVSTETSKPSLVSQAPRFTALDSDTLIVGNTVIATGVNFSTTPSQNTVKVGGQTAQVLSSSSTQLSFVVPCVATGSAPLTVTTANMTSNAVTTPTKVPAAKVRSLAVGQAMVLENATDAPCNEIAATQSPSKYIVSLFNVNNSPSANAPHTLSGDPLGEGDGPVVGQDLGFLAPAVNPLAGAAQNLAEDKHLQLLQRNAQEYVRLKARFAGDKRIRYSRSVASADVAVPPTNTTIRLPNINTNYCNTFISVNATRVYYNGKIAIYEDDATADAFKASLNPTMQSYYNKIGDQFNADMEPVVRNNFGDILLRDAVTDNNGVLIALFTPKINTTFSGVAGFVVSCDQYPRDSAVENGSSNFGQYFYAYMPTATGTGYGSFTPDSWYRSIRATFIHESKHVASMSARVNNNAAFFEAPWLEEGSARMAEEMWAREAVYNIPWKGNYGYGSSSDPKNIYCDVRPGFAECMTNTRAPVSILQRHFSSMYTAMLAQNGRLLSPFGATASDNASYWYAMSWSLIRYAIDQYGASDAAFLTALTNSTATGTDNLTARAGVSLSQLLGGWALSLAADDYPGLASPAGISQNKTWNLRNIYQGFNADFSGGGQFTSVYPAIPVPVTFGSFNTAAITTMRGGGVLWYEFSGTQTANQLLRLQSNLGGAPSSDLRVAIVRVQ